MTETFIMPLKITSGGVMPFIEDNQGAHIAVVEDRHADAIVRAVNLHDEMYAMLEAVIKQAAPPEWQLIAIRMLLAKARGGNQ